MKILIKLVVILFVFSSATNLQAIPVQWSVEDGGNGHFYEPISLAQPIIWIDARDTAAAAGGYLCTITSEEENEFVFDLVKVLPEMWTYENGDMGPWLGGYQENKDSEPAGGWRWVTDDEDWGYTNWSGGGPNNMAGVEDWLHFHGIQYPYQWNDTGFYLDYVRSYIVEVPEPATLLLLGFGGLALLRKRRG